MTNIELIKEVIADLNKAQESLQDRTWQEADLIATQISVKSNRLDYTSCPHSDVDDLHSDLRIVINKLHRWSAGCDSEYDLRIALQHLLNARKILREQLDTEMGEGKSETKDETKTFVNEPQLFVINTLAELFPEAVIFCDRRIARYYYTHDETTGIGHRVELSIRDVPNMSTFAHAQSENISLDEPLPWYGVLWNLLVTLENNWGYDLIEE